MHHAEIDYMEAGNVWVTFSDHAGNNLKIDSVCMVGIAPQLYFLDFVIWVGKMSCPELTDSLMFNMGV